MDDENNNSAPLDDSVPSGSDSVESGSNGGNDPLPNQDAPTETETPIESPSTSQKRPAPVSEPEITQEPVQSPPPETISGPTVSSPTQNSLIKNLLTRAGEKIQFNKNKKLDKIMELARQKGSVDNAEVEKLLRVSDSTASRYLNQLVKQNKLKRSGSPEKPKYELV